MSDLDISDFSPRPSASASDATQRAKKRPAGPPFIFTVEERHVFRNIMVKYRDVIENKRTDNTTKKAKDEAWSQLCEDYNSLAGTRTVCVAQLRKLWDNMKSRWKKKKSEETREIFRTDNVQGVYGDWDEIAAAMRFSDIVGNAGPRRKVDFGHYG
ncbi:hypothetical protein V5799_031512 [Amblyomma americanum]|uniref:Regulatory protein zeste n=1 Tax=Amblyomma americanum TaxID=6943 RepID=A0AAQ4EK19_AMBAM